MGFTFAKKQQIEIEGKMYDCDPTNNDLITGVAIGWPKIMQCAKQFMEIRANIFKNVQDGTITDVCAHTMTEKNQEMLKACQEFIFGTIGKDEYNDIFAGRHPNSADHLELCAYIYSCIMKGRAAYIDKYLVAPEGDRQNVITSPPNDNLRATDPDGLPVVDA